MQAHHRQSGGASSLLLKACCCRLWQRLLPFSAHLLLCTPHSFSPSGCSRLRRHPPLHPT